MFAGYEGSGRCCRGRQRTPRAQLVAGLALLLAAAACNDSGTQPAEETLGPAGGTVVSADGDATLSVPESALLRYIAITITAVDDGSLAGEALYVPGTAYSLEPHGLEFEKPVYLRIRYDPGDLPDGMVPQRLRIRERTLSAWRETVENRVRVQDHTVEAALEHFSTYGLVGIDDATIGVASVGVDHAQMSLALGESHQLVAVAMGEDGFPVTRTFTWSSSNEAVVSVAPDGTVVGHMGGSVVITAQAEGFSGIANVTVPAASVAIDPIGNEPLAAGGTLQLVAHAYDGSGTEMPTVIAWSTNAENVATVDDTGLVTGRAGGTATITASVGAASASVEVRVVGEVETFGNNLSWPVVFAEGVGVTGSPVATDAGVRPATAETDALAELAALPVTDPMAAFWWSANVPDALTGFYLQGTAATWRAQIVDGTGKAKYDVLAYWGDNIAGGDASLRVDRPIRVEVALSTADGVSLLGYDMPYVENPSSPEEIQGTDGTTSALIPLVYTVGPTLTIEQLDGPGGSVIATVSSALYKAEVNVGGRLIYGAQFRPTAAGTYRLRFILASGANVRITDSNATVVSANETAIEVQVAP